MPQENEAHLVENGGNTAYGVKSITFVAVWSLSNR